MWPREVHTEVATAVFTFVYVAVWIPLTGGVLKRKGGIHNTCLPHKVRNTQLLSKTSL